MSDRRKRAFGWLAASLLVVLTAVLVLTYMRPAIQAARVPAQADLRIHLVFEDGFKGAVKLKNTRATTKTTGDAHIDVPKDGVVRSDALAPIFSGGTTFSVLSARTRSGKQMKIDLLDGPIAANTVALWSTERMNEDEYVMFVGTKEEFLDYMQ